MYEKCFSKEIILTKEDSQCANYPDVIFIQCRNVAKNIILYLVHCMSVKNKINEA